MSTPCCPGFEAVTKCCGLKFKQVTHVIFDLDGTILDTQEAYVNAIIEIGDKYGKTFTNDMFVEISGSRERDTAEKTINLMELPLTPEEFLETYHDIARAKIADAPLMPGAENMIRHFHSNNIPMAIATSSTQESFDLKTQNYKELFELFDHVVCGGTDPEVTQGKPFPDIFLVCASRFLDNPDPSECLVFEDAPNGVQAALAAGMQVIMIPSERVPYEIWKTATLRLDNFDYMVPGAFGLPPLPSEIEDIPPIVFSIMDDEPPTTEPTVDIKLGVKVDIIEEPEEQDAKDGSLGEDGDE